LLYFENTKHQYTLKNKILKTGTVSIPKFMSTYETTFVVPLSNSYRM